MNIAKFEVLQEGWVLLSPYGDFDHQHGIQRVTPAAAEKMVRNFNSVISRLGRFFAGVPFYVGHPDCPGVEIVPDKKAYGWLMKIEARADGIYGLPKWNKAGIDLIENACYKFLSVFWQVIEIGREEGRKVFEPYNLVSVGLTNMPNLPVRPLANEKESLTPRENALEIGPLVSQELGGSREQRTDSENNQKKSVDPAPTPGSTEPTQMVELSNERLIEAVADQAILSGRMLPNERGIWLLELARDFEGTSRQLANSAVLIKVRARPENYMERHRSAAGVCDAQQKVNALVNSKQGEGLSYDAAWAAVRKEHPALFDEWKASTT